MRDVPVRAIDRGGALTTRDGRIVRALELTPLGTLAAGSELGERALDGVASLLARLTPGETLQWYAEHRPGESPAQAPERSLHAILGSPAARAVRHARAGAVGGGVGGAHRAALARSLARVDELAGALDQLGLRPRLLDGAGMSRLLLRRLRDVAADDAEPRAAVLGAIDARAEAQQALAAGGRVLDLLRGVALDFGDERRVSAGTQIEQTIAVGGVPADPTRDWVGPLLASERPFVLSVHVRAREDGQLDLSVSQTLYERGPAADATRLAAAVDASVRAALEASGVRIDRGEFTQRELWPATLPVARDAGHAAHRVDVRTAASALPLVSDRCGSPRGVPFAHGAHGRLERLDPWDPLHRHAGVAIAGGSARERACVSLALAERLAADGAIVQVLDGDGALADRLGDDAGAELSVLDARDDEQPLLSRAGRAAAALAQALARPATGGAAPRGALVVTAAERLLAEAGGGDWLRRMALHARRERCCLVAAGIELASFAEHGLLPVLPVRVLLAHPPQAAGALAQQLGLAAAEVRAIVREDGPVGDMPPALWLNGDRGRALVRLLDVPAVEAAAA